MIYVVQRELQPAAGLRKVLAGLANLDFDLVVATARARIPTVPANATLVSYAPLGPGVRLVGNPILGLANNLDQFLNMKCVEITNVGQILRAASASIAAVHKAVIGILIEPAARVHAGRMQLGNRGHARRGPDRGVVRAFDGLSWYADD